MDKEKQAQAIDFVKNKIGDSSCPIWNNKDWSINDKLVTMSAYDLEANRPRPDFGFAYVAVTCNNCSNSRFFDAQSIGIV